MTLYEIAIVPPPQENYPGEYSDFKAFNSMVPYSPPPEESKVNPQPKLVDTSFFPDDATAEFKERFLDIFVDFRVHNVTFEFPTVSSAHNVYGGTRLI